jgi:murein L,D-transpeptidase YafK
MSKGERRSWPGGLLAPARLRFGSNAGRSMNSIIRRGVAVSLTVAACAWIAGCDDSYLDQSSARSQQPISSATLADMTALDTTPSSPTLIRTYKKEAELEIWKMKSTGEYALLKTYPMCRWSGQLGPKKREGDMQVPEGFYTIAPGQMNPNSHYYLAFNVGYPNAYDRAYGRTGGNVMVHGVCSSAGCFSMTDEQVADIYAIARDSFAGGQREIQLQSYPFHMTAENMAKFRLDPNIDFWKNLKDGSDHFDVTKNEPSVLVCGKHYVFDATTKDEVSGSEPCPALKRDESVEALVAEKENKDEAKVAELAASGVKPIHLVYADGGQNPAFTGYKDVSDPDALASGPQEIVLGDRRPVPAVVKVASADANKKHAASVAPASVEAPATQAAPTTVAAASSPADQSGGMLGGVAGGAKNVQKWLHLGGQEPAPLAVDAAASGSDQAIPGAPLPPRRDDVHLASLHTAPSPSTRPNSADAPTDAPDSAQ